MKAKQQELPFEEPVRASVRAGRLHGIVTRNDIDVIVSPMGEGAQDAFERDLNAMERDFDEDDSWE